MTSGTPDGASSESLYLLTVSHTPEIAALRMQARSLSRFVHPSSVNSIVVICNEPLFEPFHMRFEAEVLQEYGVHAQKVTLLHRDTLVRPAHWRHGWRSQQMLKLLASRVLPDGWVLILDSKNHFVRPITAESYRAADGRLRTWKSHHRGHMEQFFRASLAAFDLPIEPHIDAWIPTVTPMPVPIRDIRGCVDALYEKFGPGFHDDFLHSGCRMTEFFLIAAYQFRTHGDLAARYAFETRPNSAILFKDKVVDLNRFGSVMFAASQPHTLSFAVHHAAFAALDDAQRGRIAEFWLSRGLISDIEEALPFLASPYDA